MMNNDLNQNEHNDEQLKKWLKQVHQDVDIPDGTQFLCQYRNRIPQK